MTLEPHPAPATRGATPPGRSRALRLASPPIPTQVARFAAIGVASTLAYVLLYALLRAAFSAAISNAIALVATAVANTAANRRLTFGVRGQSGMIRHQAAGLMALLVALAITGASIGLLHAVAAQASRLAEIMVLVIANALATALRFLVLRRVMERSGRPAAGSPTRATGPA